MLLFVLLVSFIGISHLADSSPRKIAFQSLLNTCTKPEYSNSTQCQHFFATYPWRNDEIKLVFTEVTRKITTNRLSELHSLVERLINLIGNPNFDLAILGKRSFHSAVIKENEPLAIAIWPQLEKYKNYSKGFYFYGNDPLDHTHGMQLYECRESMSSIILSERNMLQLLNKMMSDQPNCHDHTMKIALNIGNRGVIEFLVDHGLEITPTHVQDRYISREGFEWALLNYRHSNDLIENSIRNGSEVKAVAIWEFLKEKNYNDLLFQICNNTVIDVVKRNKVELLKTMLRDCPNTILSNGETLMDIAINEGGNSTLIIHLLNIYGVKIAPNYLHKAHSLGYTENFDWAILDSRIMLGNNNDHGYSYVVFEYYNKSAEKNKKPKKNTS